MAQFEVWAPNAQRVEVVVRSERIEMARDERGWWRVEAPQAHPADYYGFSLDGGDPLPDPRSAWQPLGVHGSSRLLDHSSFDWTDGEWRGVAPPGDIVYEMHVGTFTDQGTFDAAAAKLDHLVDLGAGAVEIMPVAEFPGDRGWGYDGVDLYAPHHSYGGPDGLKRFVDACHGRGLGVILDVVYNHLGPDGNYLGRFGPYFSDKYSTLWGDAVNLDGPGSDEVRSFFIDNALGWLEDYHCDGLRVDAVHAIFDQSAVHFLEELSARVDELKNSLGRTLFLVAESDLNDPRIVTPREAGGYGVNAAWSDDFHHALHALLTGDRSGYYADFGSVEQVAKALRSVYVYDGAFSGHRGRRHGRPVGDLPGTRFFGYVQNHDQVGNRALGERSSHLMSHELLKVGAALVLTSPFVPLLFQGEEWGASTPFCYFTDHSDPQLAHAVSEGRRREFASFGWDPAAVPDPQDPETFNMSKLNWNELDEPLHAELLEWHKQLIRLRRAEPALHDGRRDLVNVRFDEAERWLALERGPITVACNFSDRLVSVPMHAGRAAQVLLTSVEPPEARAGSVDLGPESVTIFSAES
ncbi:MAG TPA: malto-oligosyltrehalose trehalohydrolase [Actinomycetota bacterium]|nr:malto-oligosyltrehalose trehalohydrolase [Actinomycetota bacterium]